MSVFIVYHEPTSSPRSRARARGLPTARRYGAAVDFEFSTRSNLRCTSIGAIGWGGAPRALSVSTQCGKLQRVRGGRAPCAASPRGRAGFPDRGGGRLEP